jgi:hypothetical protein
VIEFFLTRWQAEKMLAETLRDEPDWRGILRVEKIAIRVPARSVARGRERSRTCRIRPERAFTGRGCA